MLLFAAAALVVAVNAQGVKPDWAALAGLCRGNGLRSGHAAQPDMSAARPVAPKLSIHPKAR